MLYTWALLHDFMSGATASPFLIRECGPIHLGPGAHRVASAGRMPVRLAATASSVYPGSLLATTDWNARRKPAVHLPRTRLRTS